MTARTIDIFTPTEEHALLRKTVRKFTEEEVEPGALARDANEQFDPLLFKKLGDLGLLGITAPEEYGGSGMDAVAAVLVHEELSAADPGFTLAYLAHAMLCVNNIAHSASTAQK